MDGGRTKRWLKGERRRDEDAEGSDEKWGDGTEERNIEANGGRKKKD